MDRKTQQLQIRVTPRQKAVLRRLARAAGCDVSTYVLSRIAPAGDDRFADLVGRLADEADRRYVLAELHDFLHACPPMEFPDAVANPPSPSLTDYWRNYVAAMVEVAAEAKGVAPPAWVGAVLPLEAPHFVAPLKSLRLHLLRSSPVPFKRRNLFVDASVGARV
jgi:uncharacterized protein (DUF1778 family)